MTSALTHMLKLIEIYKLYVIPLCSIDASGCCTCGKSDCASPGKHPHFRFNWKLAASNDPVKIHQWTQKYTNLNWGVLTGRRSPVSGKFLTVIDIDRKRHEMIKMLPDTFSYSTGQGQHCWYWSVSPVKNSVSQVAKHVDIRGMNGYVVIPPSKHRSGASYRFLKLMDYKISELPSSFNNLSYDMSDGITGAVRQTQTTLNVKTPIWQMRKAMAKGTKISLGMRNITIHRLLSSDRAKGAEKAELVKKASYYKALCEESSSVSNVEIARIVYSVLKYPVNKNLANSIELSEEVAMFFRNSLRKSELFATPIRDVRQAMQLHLIKNGGCPTSYITDQWLAAQLESCGFKKKRTAQGNRWLLRLI